MVRLDISKERQMCEMGPREKHGREVMIMQRLLFWNDWSNYPIDLLNKLREGRTEHESEEPPKRCKNSSKKPRTKSTRNKKRERKKGTVKSKTKQRRTRKSQRRSKTASSRKKIKSKNSYLKSSLSKPKKTTPKSTKDLRSWI